MKPKCKQMFTKICLDIAQRTDVYSKLEILSLGNDTLETELKRVLNQINLQVEIND